MSTTPTPDITLYFLQASRSIRIAGLLEELNLPYKSVFFPCENNKAPVDFGARSGNPLKKAPAINDGGLVVSESGAITEYLIEKYDSEQRFLGGRDAQSRNRVRMFVHAAEGTFMVHCLAITYARWFCPEAVRESGALLELERGLAVNVCRDLDWLEGELEGRRFLGGETVTAADTMVLFSVQFIFARNLNGGRKVDEWRNVKKWIAECEATETWKKAVKKTGHEM